MRKGEWAQLLLAYLLSLCGIGLLAAGLAVSPTGVIDGSVLVAFGEVMTFAGALMGIDYHYRYKQRE